MLVYTYTLKHMYEVENVADALSRQTSPPNQKSTEVVGFDKIKQKYDSCPEFEEIVVLLKEGLTSEINGFRLQNDYLF